MKYFFSFKKLVLLNNTLATMLGQKNYIQGGIGHRVFFWGFTKDKVFKKIIRSNCTSVV